MDLSDFFITKAQAIDFMTKLTAIIDSMYTTSFSLEGSLAKQFGIAKKDAFLKLFRENNVNNANITEVQAFLKKIQETVGSLPLVELTLAFEPTDEVLKAFAQWFVATCNKQMLLEIRIDHHLIGGALVTSRGRSKDYSLTKRFTDIVSASLIQKPAHPASQIHSDGTQQISNPVVR